MSMKFDHHLVLALPPTACYQRSLYQLPCTHTERHDGVPSNTVAVPEFLWHALLLFVCKNNVSRFKMCKLIFVIKVWNSSGKRNKTRFMSVQYVETWNIETNNQFNLNTIVVASFIHPVRKFSAATSMFQRNQLTFFRYKLHSYIVQQ